MSSKEPIIQIEDGNANLGFMMMNSNGGMEYSNGVVQQMISAGMHDPGLRRPYINSKGQSLVTNFVRNQNGKPVYRTLPTTNALLLKDEWIRMDASVRAAAEKRLQGVRDLIDNGLTLDIGSGMDTTIFQTQRINSPGKAQVAMEPLTKGENSRPQFDLQSIPIPVIWMDYTINMRVLTESRNRGIGLDTRMAGFAGIRVAEKLEEMLFTDYTFEFGGAYIYSYLNYPDKMVYTIQDDWLDSNTTPKMIVDDIIAMKQQQINNRQWGPYTVYISSDYETLMDMDYEQTTSSGKTIRERILQIENVKSIKVVDTLPASTVLMINMNEETVRLLDGMPLQSIQWENQGGFVLHMKAMQIALPQIGSDYNGRCGVLVASSS